MYDRLLVCECGCWVVGTDVRQSSVGVEGGGKVYGEVEEILYIRFPNISIHIIVCKHVA